ncbi:SDR family NAD(P)-dependent oxidoreductase [Rhodohalobacter halophilus]|uniref:SDR family NAD(P)-dependent oxidoreductase n=1 Tax=Rhodohalobacter halophilus TaxID=1812810 RepID=UPI00083FD545|nr:SDR family oxidoreductase [Rhodohalobacter halophilus]
MSETALITGASSGIGKELAKVFARNQYNLILTARREHLLNDLKKEISDQYAADVHIFPADLAHSQTVNSLFRYCKENNLQVDVLVNNAGIGDYGLFQDSVWWKTETMIDLNMKSLTHLTHLFLPQMLERRHGKIMNVASTAAFQPGPLMSVYYATKHYVLAFSEALANEVADQGVIVTALCPGPTQSEFQATANMEKSKLMDRFPLPSSKEVAEFGFKKMMSGKRIAIYGWMNKVTSFVVKFFPRRWVTAMVRKIQERK